MKPWHPWMYSFVYLLLFSFLWQNTWQRHFVKISFYFSPWLQSIMAGKPEWSSWAWEWVAVESSHRDSKQKQRRSRSGQNLQRHPSGDPFLSTSPTFQSFQAPQCFTTSWGAGTQTQKKNSPGASGECLRLKPQHMAIITFILMLLTWHYTLNYIIIYTRVTL